MGHTIICIVSVYLTAIVGCAISSPGRPADSDHSSVKYEAPTTGTDQSHVSGQKDTDIINTTESPTDPTQISDDPGGEIVADENGNDTSNREHLGMYNESAFLFNQNETTLENETEISSNVQILENEEFNFTTEELNKAVEMEHIAAIKSRILSKLRLDSPPRLVGARPVLPFKHLEHEYISDEAIGKKRRRTPHDFYARKKQVLVMGTDVTNECTNKKGTGCYHFDVTGKVNPDDVYTAEIWVYKLFNRYDPYVQTFLVSELGLGNHRKRRPKNMVNRVETRMKHGWLRIEIKRTVMRWLQKPYENAGIAVLCQTCKRRNPRMIFSFKSDTRPFLIITVRKGHNARHPRSVPRICTETSTECCLKPLTINFHDLGWDGMIHPVTFEANYCFGSCEAQYQAHYNHTQIIQDHRWNINNWNLMRRLTPCCAPVSYSPLSLLYMDNNDFVVVKVPNLVATACGCV